MATSADVTREFGNTHDYVTGCGNSQVRVDITTSKYEIGSSVDRPLGELVRRAIVFAIERCQPSPSRVDWITVNYRGDQELIVFGAALNDGGGDFHFDRVENDYSNNWWGHFDTTAWFLMKAAFWGGIALFLFSKWETFARWYYIFTPHPAAEMVHAAVAGGAIDGKVFADLMRPVPGSRIERQVRVQQARRLETLARETEAQLRRRADEAKRKLQEEATFRAAQRDMHDAMVDAQLAKARADLFEQLAESLRQSAEAK